MRKLKARLGAWLSLLGLPLLLAPLLLLDEGGGGNGGDPPAGDPPAGDPPKSFNQDDVDRIVRERLARAKSEPPADYEDLRKAKAKLDELEAASRTELERATARAEEAERKAAEADVERAHTKMETAVLLAASKAGAVKPQQVFALLPKNAVTVGDDGQVTGAEDAVKAFLEENKHLVGTVSTPTGDGDGGSRGGGDAEKPKTLEDAVSRALTKTG